MLRVLVLFIFAAVVTSTKIESVPFDLSQTRVESDMCEMPGSVVGGDHQWAEMKFTNCSGTSRCMAHPSETYLLSFGFKPSKPVDQMNMLSTFQPTDANNTVGLIYTPYDGPVQNNIPVGQACYFAFPIFINFQASWTVEYLVTFYDSIIGPNTPIAKFKLIFDVKSSTP